MKDLKGNDTQVRGSMRPMGYCQYLNVTNATAINLQNNGNSGVGLSTFTPPNIPRIAVIVSEAQSIRYRDDGTAPTSTVGFPIAANAPVVYDGQLEMLQMIAQANNANISILYYG